MLHQFNSIQTLYFTSLKIYTNKKKVNKQEVATKRSYNQSNNYPLMNDVIFNFHDVKRNLSLHEMVYINGKDSWLESIFNIFSEACCMF